MSCKRRAASALHPLTARLTCSRTIPVGITEGILNRATACQRERASGHIPAPCCSSLALLSEPNTIPPPPPLQPSKSPNCTTCLRSRLNLSPTTGQCYCIRIRAF